MEQRWVEAQLQDSAVGNRLRDVGVYLGLIARRVGALCGIRATGKYFPPARHRRAHRVKRAEYRKRALAMHDVVRRAAMEH